MTGFIDLSFADGMPGFMTTLPDGLGCTAGIRPLITCTESKARGTASMPTRAFAEVT